VEKVEDVAQLGSELTVMITSIDPEGKIRLSRQAVLEGWTPEEAMERDRRSPSRRPEGGSRGGRPSGGRGGQRGGRGSSGSGSHTQRDD
jgi:polyribonucleotide nucleotidyltransferase